MSTAPPFLLGVEPSILPNLENERAWKDLSSQISGFQRVVAEKDRGEVFQGGRGFAVFT